MDGSPFGRHFFLFGGICWGVPFGSGRVSAVVDAVDLGTVFHEELLDFDVSLARNSSFVAICFCSFWTTPFAAYHPQALVFLSC